MKNLKHILSIALFIFSTSLIAQIDTKTGTEEKGKKKIALPTNAKKITKPKTLDNDNKNGFQKAFDKQQEKNAKQKEEEDLNNKGILTKAKIAEERYLKSFKRINGQFYFPKIDQDLGSFRTQSKQVRIICRDFQFPDGDKVTIMVNEIPVVVGITLRTTYQSFDIPLEVGLNKISFVALNQGSSGPNTAAFKVYDDQGRVISSNEWNLATGAKATILIAKDK